MRPVSIIRYPARILQVACDPVELPDHALLRRWEWIARRACEMYDGYAVAAPQIGIAKQFFYYDVGGRKGLAVNPQIVGTSTSKLSEREACLSIPNKGFDVERSLSVTWNWYDSNMQPHLDTWEGLMARVVQHEMDHLGGITLADLSVV